MVGGLFVCLFFECRYLVLPLLSGHLDFCLLLPQSGGLWSEGTMPGFQPQGYSKPQCQTQTGARSYVLVGTLGSDSKESWVSTVDGVDERLSSGGRERH